MRDRNLPSPEQFNIQLEKTVLRSLTTDDRFSRTPVSDSPTLLDDREFAFSYSRSFRELRSLCIVQWYLPEMYHWRIWSDLDEMNFNWLNWKQEVILRILLTSKETCLVYLYSSQSFSSEELFGNILRTDIKDTLRSLKIRRKGYKLIPLVYRRGYRDKGARKPDHKWLPREDAIFTIEQNDLEKKRNFYLLLFQRIQEFLEKKSWELGFKK
jgi:hypothetical protein